METASRGLVNSTIIITVCAITGIAISFISQVIIAYYFGAKFERDAYFVASTIPTYLSTIFTGSIGIVFLPKVIDLLNKNPNKVSDFLSTVFFAITLLSILLGGICILFSHKIIAFVASGFNTIQNSFASKILIIIIPTFVLSVLTNLLSSLYQIHNKFLRPALASLITSVVSLIFIFALSDNIGIFGLAFGLLFGSIISFIYLLPILKKYKLKIHFNLKNADLISFVNSVVPLFFTGILFQSTNIFERNIASNLQEGSISYLGYTTQILSILGLLTSAGVGVSIYPTLSRLWSENKISEFNHFFYKAIRIIVLISIPISLLIIFFGDVFVRILFERGAFTHNETVSVSKALIWSMGAFVFLNLGNVVIKIFYISGKTALISILATIELILYICLGFFLSRYFSFVGLSIALSFSRIANILLSFFFINKIIIKTQIGNILKYSIKIFILSLISIFVIFRLHIFYCSTNIFLLFFLIILGFLIFFILGLIFNIEEFLYIKDLLKRFNLKKKLHF